MKPRTQILLLTAAFVVAIAATSYAQPIDECSRPVFWKTLTGSCHEATSLQRPAATASVDKPSKPSKPDKPSRPDKPSKPSKPDKPSRDNRDNHGNASANNGKGGNYDRTGHHDNGHGKGRNKK